MRLRARILAARLAARVSPIGDTFLAVAPAALLLWTPSVVSADQPVGADQFQGSYKFAGGAKEKAKIEAALEKATEDMFPGIRGIARNRLAESNFAIAKIEIQSQGSFVKINQVGFRSVTAPSNGVAIPYRSKQGDKTKVSHKMVGGKLVQRLVTGEGGRENSYSLSADGSTMTLSVRIWSKRLTRDVKYKLTYKRS
jgi:hypothetical protein